MRSLLGLLLVLFVAGGPVAVARAQVQTQAQEQGEIGKAAAGLARDPVYVASGREALLSGAEAQALRERIERGDAGPVYVAILPSAALAEAGGDPNEVVRQLAAELGRRGTYAVVAGNRFRAFSSTVGGAGALATEALQAHGADGVAPTLDDFVARLADARANGGANGGGSDGSGGTAGGGDATGALVLLGLIGGGGALALTASRRRRQRAERAQLDDLKAAARDDLVALGDDVRDVDLDVEMPSAHPRAREELARGLAAYEEAERRLDAARHPDDIATVTRTIDDGRQAMAACRALLDGREPPPRRLPCFFDPRHGPSVTDAEWAPPGGQPREVPVCAADAARLADGVEPATREVMAGGAMVPYYAAPAYFGPWAGGFFGGGSLFLPGLLAGTLLGGSLFGPTMAWGSEWGDGGGWGDDGGGDDIGGGDFGGGFGDIGGGDFGGGDFGGGDF
jgi:hypothetical protein